jgi:glycosyltransferase involved in cell wall biosynthesis
MIKHHFSVLISTYKNDCYVHLDAALQSVMHQTYPPAEVVLIIDGEVSIESELLIKKYHENYPGIFKLVRLAENKGLGFALSIGLMECSYNFVARMDADDICCDNRFELQYLFLQNNNDIAAVGSYITEFISMPGDLNKQKVVPNNHQNIVKYSRFRNPLNHPTVMFRKDLVLEAGNYRHMPLFEDYYLWLKLINKGYKLANISQSLLFFRFSNEALQRRQGFSYLKKEFHFFNTCYQESLISFGSFCKLLLLRLPLRLVPYNILRHFYLNILRK